MEKILTKEVITTICIIVCSLVKIPTPYFIVLYNGKDHYPINNKLYLSDSFYDNTNLKLELVVDVININYDVHSSILDKSSTLNNYSYFIHLVRTYTEMYKSSIDKKELLYFSIKKSIETCINQNILSDFFKSNGSEVINMLSTEFNLDDAKLIWTQEGFQEGLKQGILKQIEMLKEFNFSREDIITRIKKDYNLTTEEIEKLL